MQAITIHVARLSVCLSRHNREPHKNGQVSRDAFRGQSLEGCPRNQRGTCRQGQWHDWAHSMGP